MKKIAVFAAIVVWTVTIGLGAVWLTDYATRPGKTALSPTVLPDDGTASARTPKLIVFFHPHCPCSRATLTELSKIAQHNPSGFRLEILFYQPEGQSEAWGRSEIRESAEGFTNAVVRDVDAKELRRFGALTSGQVLLYNGESKLVFSGGITKMRGHEGDNAGSALIEKHLRGELSGFSETPVYGCILTTENE